MNTPNLPEITAIDLIALSLVPGAGRRAVHGAIQLARRIGRPLGAMLGVEKRALLEVAAPGEEASVSAISTCGEQEREHAAAIKAQCAKAGIRYCTCTEATYPRFLSTALAMQAPPVLFFQGNEALLQQTGAAVVGRQRPSEAGAEWARAAARHFAQAGIPVVSGGASGIDLEAHRAALMLDGTTVVVLPEGIGSHLPHPAVRIGLKNGQALLVSEFLPSDGWRTHRAMTRNRTIAACARLVCVVEPRATGGSIFTAERALASGTPVFYWGGACIDGALAGRHGAASLVRAGGLATEALDAAVERAPAGGKSQGDLFED